MYKFNKNSWVKHIDFILVDCISLQIAYTLAYGVRFGNFEANYYNRYREVAVMLLFIGIFSSIISRNYAGIIRRGEVKELKAVIKYSAFVAAVSLFVMFATQELMNISRTVFAMTIVFGIILTYIFRYFLKCYLRKQITRVTNQRAITVVTTSNLVNDIIEKIKKDKYQTYAITGLILMDEHSNMKEVEGIPIVANEQTALEYLKSNVVDEVFFNFPKEVNLPETLINACKRMGITVHLNLLSFMDFNANNKIEKIGAYTVITSSIKMVTLEELMIKRLFDLVGGFVGVVITAFVTVIVAPIIYIQSPGPIFFSQKRVGLNGRIFKIYKFRSMYMDAEERKKELMKQNEMQGFMFKMKDDPRIFPFGHFIRKWSIDELPQLFNVLKGEMSLVGTRPPTVDEYEQYEYQHKRRLATKPGLTGMWQVSGRSDITDFEEVVALDSKYIEEWSVGLDIRILFKTVGVVLGKKGSV